MRDLTRFLVPPSMRIREVMERIERAAGIALVVDEERRLLGTINDGDIRRAILAGIDLDRPASLLIGDAKPPQYVNPLTAPVGTPKARLLQMMADSGLRHIPLINDSGQVDDVAILGELTPDYELPVTAVVMAGGFGTRLRPLTDDVPKPMLPLGDRPVLEHIVDQLRTAGIRKVNITTHYKSDLIVDHFGDGTDFGVDIRYVSEKEPLGTAGALSLLASSEEPTLVINGDIVTKVDLRAMLDFHREHLADMTVAVRQQEFTMPFGIVEMDGVELTRLSEKPTLQHLINAGIYMLGHEACRRVPNGRPYDMTDLIEELISSGAKVIGFPIQEYWLDIGHAKDYERAQAEAGESPSS